MKLTLEKGFYILGWIIAAVTVVLLLAYKFFEFDMFNFSMGCMMYDEWGLYCPGCGGTRALKSLLTGQIFKSIYYNPIVAYGVLIYAVYMISHTLSIFTKGKVKGMKYSDTYAYIAIIIVVVHFVVKNALILMGIIA